jgi:hypothetical protein
MWTHEYQWKSKLSTFFENLLSCVSVRYEEMFMTYEEKSIYSLMCKLGFIVDKYDFILELQKFCEIRQFRILRESVSRYKEHSNILWNITSTLANCMKNQEIGVRFPTGQDFLLFSFASRPVLHPTKSRQNHQQHIQYWNHIWGSFHRVKGAWIWSWQLDSIWCRGYEYMEL